MPAVECTTRVRGIHISLSPDIFIAAHLGKQEAVGYRTGGHQFGLTVPVVADSLIGDGTGAVEDMGANHIVSTFALLAVVREGKEYRRITLRFLNKDGIVNRLYITAIEFSTHFVNQGIVIRQTGGNGLQNAVGGYQRTVDIPLVAHLGGNGTRLVVNLYLRQVNVVNRIDCRTGIIERYFGVERTADDTFLNTAYQHFVLIVVDIAVLTDNEQYIAFMPLAAAPDTVAAFVNHQGGITVFLTYVEAVVGIVTAPVVIPVTATGMAATLVVDTHHGRGFLAGNHVAVNEIAVQIGGRGKIGPTSACAITDNLGTVDIDHVARIPPSGRLRRRTVAGIDNLFGFSPQAFGMDNTHIDCIAARATVAGGFHFEIGRFFGHGQYNHTRVAAYARMMNVEGCAVVERGPLIVDARILLGQSVQG